MPQMSVMYEDTYESTIEIYKRSGKYDMWYLFAPAELTYIDYLKRRNTFYHNYEINRIELVESGYISALNSREVSVILMGIFQTLSDITLTSINIH